MLSYRQFDLEELVDRANDLRQRVPLLRDIRPVTRRSVRYYVEKRLLPRAERSGPSAPYPEDAVYTLLFVRVLQQERRLSIRDIKRALKKVPKETIRRVVEGVEPLTIAVATSKSSPEVEARRAAGEEVVVIPLSGEPAMEDEDRRSESDESARSVRMRVMPGVDLRIRRPLSGKQIRQLRAVCRLIEATLTDEA